MTLDRETLDNLQAWYWEFGAHRAGRFALPASWPHILTEIEDGHIPARDTRREILIWGEASAFSHTYLNRAFGSALRAYGEQKSSLFSNNSVDQTSIAVKFSTVGEFPHHASTLGKIELLTLPEILTALSMGYAHFSQDTSALNIEHIEALLSSDSRTGAVEPSAMDLLGAFLTATSALCAVSYPRFAPLNNQDIWERQLRGQASRNPEFRRNQASIKDAIADVFWGRNAEITEFFDTLRNERMRIMGLLNGKKLFVTQAAISLLLADETRFISLDSRIDRRSAKGAKDFQSKIRSLELIEYDDYCLLDFGTGDGDLFATETSIAVFIGLIKSICFKVSPDETGKLGHASASYLNAYDIVVLPKPGIDFLKYDQGRSWTLDAPRGHDGLSRRLLKHGKAASALSFKSPEFAACICFVAPDFPETPQTTISMLTAKLTTIYVIGGIDFLLAKGVKTFSKVAKRLQTIRDNTNALPILGISVGDKAFNALESEAQDKAADAIANAEIFQSLVPSAEAEKQFFSALVVEDEGMGNVLETLTSQFARTASLSQRRAMYAEDEIAGLVELAVPRSNFATNDHKYAFLALNEAITVYCLEPEKLSDRRHNVEVVSEKLREAVSIRSEDLEPIPRWLGNDHDAASTFINNQLIKWASRPALEDLFDLLNLPPFYSAEIVKSIQAFVPVDEIGIWLTKEFGEIGANREALHCRRYVATRLSKEIFDLSQVQLGHTSGDSLMLQEQLDIWARPTAELEESLHYQMVIAPMIARFAEIAEMTPIASWVKQPGDEEIELIANAFEG